MYIGSEKNFMKLCNGHQSKVQRSTWMSYLALFATAISPMLLHAQFQAPSSEELGMTSDPKAPGAAAVYLNVEDSSDDDLHSRIVYVKIKVLREQGKELARVVIPSQSDPNTRRDLATMQLPYQSTSMQLALPSQVTGTGLFITDFKARTTHPDGTVVPLEGKLENLLKIETSQQHTRQTVVYLPGVEVGSIVEYRYAERYDGFYTSPQWDIQRNYFVHKAHFSFLPYKSFRSGTENATGSYLMDRHGAPLNFLLYWPQLPPGAELKRDTIGRFFLDVTDVPAAPEDDWMPPSSSLLYRVRFYYKGNSDAKGFWVKEARQWSKEVDRLAEPTKAIQDAVQGLVTHNDSDLDKARKLYKAVQELQNTDFTNKQENAAAKPETQNGKRAEDTWTQKSGSSQDIALLYLAMLRAAGLTAYDMKVVNRDRGTFAPDYLYLGQLDDDIILVMIGGKETVLDPGQKMCPFQMVHWKHTGAGGIREGADSRPSVTSPLQPYTTNTVLRMGEIKVDEHGAAVGSFRFVMAGQEALYWRQESLRSAEADLSKEFDQWLESNTPQGSEAHLDRFEGLDNPEANLVAILRVKASFATSEAKSLKLPAFFFETRSPEPFVDLPHRSTPVDMHYGEQITDQVTYDIPAGVQIEHAPQDERIPWGENAIFAVKTKSAPNQITIARSLARSFIFEKPEEYDNLRSFYQKVAAADQEELIVSSAPAAGAN